MATPAEYMQFALSVYGASEKNTIGVPEGWSLIDWQPDRWTGFSAGAYKNNATNEIVISFTGTNDFADMINWTAGLGLPLPQIFDAMAYYWGFKTAFPTANITFTGHSLGGGLASLMAVFFNKQATVFDEAPLQPAAQSPTVLVGAAAAMLMAGLRDADLVAYLDSRGTLANTRELKVTQYSIAGEALSKIRWPANTLVGNDELPISLGNSNASPVERHSMALLTALQVSSSFLNVVQKLPDLVTQLLDKKLFSADARNVDKADLLRKLIKHQLGVSGEITPDRMLERFATDMQKITAQGDLSTTDEKIIKTLTAFAMQMYSENSNASGTSNNTKELFNFDGIAGQIGGLHFNRSDVAAKLENAEGYNHYFRHYLNFLPGAEINLSALEVIKKQLPELIDWYIQVGSTTVNATAANQRAFMLGGNGADNLTGGSANDVLIGGKGGDRLNGGAGNDTLVGNGGNDSILGGDGEDELYGNAGDDTLNGGAGYDKYIYKLSEGNDTIIDTGANEIKIYDLEGHLIQSNVFYNQGANTWKNTSGKVKVIGNKLILADGSEITLADANLEIGDFGINLIDIPNNPVATNVVYEDVVDPAYLNHQVTPDYGTSLDDMIVGGAGNDWVGNWSNEGLYGGKDWIIGGIGNDILNSFSPIGNDVIEGNAGIDVLLGNGGSNKMFCGDYGEMDALLAAGERAQSLSDTGDVASGGEGDDFIYGSNAKDGLFGGLGNDFIIGGGGDDFIYSDAHVYGVNLEQSQIVRLEDNYAGFLDWSYSVQGDAGGTFATTLHNVYVDQNSYGNLGEDVIYAGTGKDYVDGGYGDDEIYGGADNDTIFGSAGNDFIEGGTGEDILIGDDAVAAGNDYIDGGDGNDYIEGQRGSDELFGGSGDDAVYGNEDDDYLDGELGNDILYGNGGNDELFGGADIDILYGNEGNDYLDGEDGIDSLYGGAGDDELFGGDDNDYIEGDNSDVAGNDYLDGGAGNDTIIGAGGEDEIFGGDGNDILHGDASSVAPDEQGDDYIDGEGGDNLLVGYGGNDTLYAAEGDDTIYGDAGDDYIDAGDGTNVIYSGEGNDEIYAGAGDDQIDAGFGDDCIDAGDGSNIIVGGEGNNEIHAGAGDDQISGGTGNDYIDAGEGNNIITSGAGDDIISSGAGNDQIWGGAGVDEIYSGAGDDRLYDESEDSIIYGGEGNDWIQTTDGNSYLDGGGGNDTLLGGTGNDTIYGGTENDYLQGNSGSDTYIFGRGDGSDTIQNYATDYTTATDILQFGASINDITVTKENNDLRISINDTTDSLLIWDWFSGSPYQIDQIQFSDGTMFNSMHLEGKIANTINGTGENNYIVGENISDTIYGYAGNDWLYGGGGTNLLDGGDGNDWLYSDCESVNDILIGGTGNDTLLGGSKYVSMMGGTGDDIYRVGIETQVVFEDAGEGIDIIYSDVESYTLPANVENLELDYGRNGTGNNLDNTIKGNANYNTLIGGAGDDEIWGYDGDDILGGGDGNDTLVGSSTQWRYWWDWRDLSGNANGNDTYLFGRGYGQDVVLDRDALLGNADTILLDNSIQPEDLILCRGMGTNRWNTADDLVLSVNGANDKMTVMNWFDENGEWQVERIQFSDGTVWDEQTIKQTVLQPTEGEDYLIGYDSEDFINGSGGNDYIEGRAGNDIITGGRGDDILYGGAGDDTYYFNLGDGTDTIYDNDVEVYVDNNTIIFGDGITPGMIRLKKGSLLIEVGDNRDSIRIPDFNSEDARANPAINTFVFADGTTLTYDELIDKGFDLEGTANDDPMAGTNVVDRINSFEGNDTVFSSAGDDIINGGTGNDELYGGSGSDTYVFNLGDGVDAITDVSGLNEGNTIHFGEGITKNDLFLVQNDGILTINIGTNGDAINLLNFDENEITGSLVVRTLEFADGSQIKLADLLNRAPVAANQITPQTAMEDTVFNFTIPKGSFVDPDTGDSLTYRATLIDGTALPSWLVFDAATMTFSGTPTNDDIGVLSLQVTATDTFGACVSSGFNVTVQPIVNYGTNHTDFIITGSKRDFINALGGADIVYTGEGNDTIYGGNGTDLLCGDGGNDEIYGENDSDMISGGKGNDILDGGAGRDIMLGGAGNDTYIVDNTGDIITEFYNEGTDIIQSSITYKVGNNVEDLTLTGIVAINGTGNNLNNKITGNNADNTLTGNAGNDSLDGRKGDDTLAGGKGSDTYLFGRNDGYDTITETAGVSGDTDALKLTGDIMTTEPVLVKQNNDLYVFIDSENYMKIVNEYQQTNYGIERLEVTDGHYITRADIQNIVDTMSAINNDSGMDVIQKYNAMMADQQYQNILTQSWQQ